MPEPAESAIEARLRAYLAGELRRAEIDYPQTAVLERTGRRSWRPVIAAALVVVAVAAVVLVRPWAGPPGTSIGGVPTPSVGEPVASPTVEACAAALAQGFLAVKDGALVLQATTGDTQAIVWPSGYSVQGGADALVLVDPHGAIAARPGDYIKVGGGVFSGDVFEGCGDVTVVRRSDATPPTRGTVIDGFTIGVTLHCSGHVGSIDPSLERNSCSGQLALALAALDARDPGHDAVISTAMYTDGTQPEPVDVTGNAPTPTPPPTAHPGPLVTVFVFILADGSVHATGVACPDSGSCVGVGSYPN